MCARITAPVCRERCPLHCAVLCVAINTGGECCVAKALNPIFTLEIWRCETVILTTIIVYTLYALVRPHRSTNIQPIVQSVYTPSLRPWLRAKLLLYRGFQALEAPQTTPQYSAFVVIFALWNFVVSRI